MWFRKQGKALLGACAEVSRRHPWWVLGLSLVLTVAAGLAATRIGMNTGIEDILNPNLPFRQLERDFAKAFPDENERIIVVVDAASSDAAEAAATRLADALRRRSGVFEYVEVPGADAFFRRHALLYLDTDQLNALSARLAGAQAPLTVLGSDPSLRGFASLVELIRTGIKSGAAPPPELGRLFASAAETVEARAEGRAATLSWTSLFEFGTNPLGTRRLVMVRPVLDNSTIERAEPALTALRQEIAKLRGAEAGREVTMRITGDPALRQQELNDAFSGAMTASVLSFILVTLSLLAIRSGRLIAALLVTLVIGTVWTTGLAALTVGRLNLISVAFTVLFFGLGVDFGTHVALRFREEMRAGASRGEAIRHTILGEGPAISLGALCASIGFLAFVPTNYLGLAELGIISAFGMAVAVVISLTVLPAMITVLRPSRPKADSSIEIPIGGWIKRRYRGILTVAALVSVAALFLVPQSRLDVNPLNLQDPRTEPVRAYRDLAANPETSPYALNVLVPDLEAARSLSERLAKADGVGGVRTIASFVPESQDEKLTIISDTAALLGSAIDRPAAQPAPDDRARLKAFTDLRRSVSSLATEVKEPAVAQPALRLAAALGRFEDKRGTGAEALRDLDAALMGGLPALLGRLRELLSVEEPITVESLPPELRRDWVAADGRIRVQVRPARDISDPEALEAFAARIQAVAPTATGVPVSVSEAGQVVLGAFARAIAYAAIAITLLVIMLRRRLSDVLLILFPLVLAALWTVAASAAFDVPFNFANVIVIPLLLGLGVVASIHMVVRAREVVEADHGAGAAAVLDTSTPLAVLIAELNTIAAFATLAVSPHRGMFSMGVLLATAVLCTSMASIVVLPSLMIALDKWKGRGGAGSTQGA